MRRLLLIAGLALALYAPAASAAPSDAVRDATARDNAAHPGSGARTEWWFASAIDPAQDLAVAVALGSDFPRSPPASVAFLYLPGRAPVVLVAPRLTGARASTRRADVRMGPDRLREVRPGVWQVRVEMNRAIPVVGADPGPVRVDLTLRARAPGFVAGPLALPGGQDLSWAVPAPRAVASGAVRVGARTYRLRGAPAYHDHNFGRFDLADPAHGGWDWSQVHLPGGRSLATGVVRPDGTAPGGAAVLSDASRRLGVAGVKDVSVTRSRWRLTGGYAYPTRVRVRARLSGGWRADLRLRPRVPGGAAPLEFNREDGHAVVEIPARVDGTLRRDGRVVSRVRDAPGFYEYESTPLTRQRDAAPGSLTWLGDEVARLAHLAQALADAVRAVPVG